MSSESGPTLDDIGSFRVTSREGEKVASFVNLNEEAIRSLPEQSIILEVGSGLFQDFSEHVKKIRPDVTVISMDPTLGFIKKGDHYSVGDGSEFDLAAYDDEKGRRVYFTRRQDGLNNQTLDNFKVSLQEERIRHAKEHGGLAALAPRLPFADGSVDLVVDSFGPGTWFLEEPDFASSYLTELVRVIKSNGKVTIFPVDTAVDYMEYPNPSQDSERNRIARERVSMIMDRIAEAERFYFYEKEVVLKDKQNTRIGVEIRKS